MRGLVTYYVLFFIPMKSRRASLQILLSRRTNYLTLRVAFASRPAGELRDKRFRLSDLVARADWGPKRHGEQMQRIHAAIVLESLEADPNLVVLQWLDACSSSLRTLLTEFPKYKPHRLVATQFFAIHRTNSTSTPKAVVGSPKEQSDS